MQPSQDPAEISDTIVVGGDYTDDSQEGSDDSFDAYEEVNDGQEQKNEPGALNGDYARTCDSPAKQEQQTAAAAESHPDVSKDSPESMKSASSPDLKIESKSPAHRPATSSKSPCPDPAPTNGVIQPSPSLSEQAGSSKDSNEPAEQLSAPKASPAPPSSLAKPPPDELKDDSAHAPGLSRSPVPVTAGITLADEDDAAPIDIEKLVEDFAAKAARNSPPAAPQKATDPSQTPPSQTAPAGAPSLSYHASLPPKPVVVETGSHNSIPSSGTSMSTAKQAAQRGAYTKKYDGAAGSARWEGSSLARTSIPPPTSFNASQHEAPVHRLPANVHSIPGPSDASLHTLQAASTQQDWEAFLADEKKYTTEAKWDRFPEGARIFIGNLSSERVPKREVFDVFHKFGRLAQISMKSAFGFVQYHTAEEGKLAVQHAQGIEMGGRKIHLEISRTKKKEERNRSPDRRDSRGSHDRFEGRDAGWRRDDYRRGRSPSPRQNGMRNNGNRDGFYSRDREPGNAFDRRRSRSPPPPPPRFSRLEKESYRRRSPSPPRRATAESDQLDLPRRYGSDIPDIQLLLLQEVDREFVSWVQRAFNDRGLKTDVMFLSPRFPRDAVVRRQVLEGVHAIVDLDFGAQAQGKLDIQVFSRSGGNNVRFDSYKGLEPSIAAELVLREKSKPIVSPVQPQAPYQQMPPYISGYSADPPAHYPYPYPHPPAPPPAVSHPAPAPAPAPDLASMLGQLDNTSLQALLASIQNNPTLAQPQMDPHAGYPPAPAGPQALQVDINLLLGNLRNASASQLAAPPPAQEYPPVPSYGPVSPPGMGAGAPNAAIVQNIMDQLKRATQ